jgi:biopolymer transport protein ExbD
MSTIAQSHPRKRLHAENPDMLPIMNLFSILIPFLITVVSFQKLAIVEVDLPSASQEVENLGIDTEGELELSLVITAQYLQVVSNFGSLPQILRTTPGGAYAHLRSQLEELRNRYADMPGSDRATVVAADEIPFDDVIQVMDAARDAGMPGLQLAKIEGS